MVKEMTEQLQAFSDTIDDEMRAAIIARVRGYSERNAMLIVMQLEDATDVRGYAEWLKNGRQVRKGEHGIKILAPAGKSDEVDGKKSRQFFRLVSVFDVSQTEEKESS